MKRIILIVTVLGVVLLAALVVFLFTGLGAAIKAVVEGVGSRATGTEVTLASADVSLTSGEGTLDKLVVGNPEGYGTKSAIELGRIHVQIDTATVTSDTVVIKEILIDGPHLTYEVGPGGSNIGVIQENLSKLGGGSGGGGTEGGGSKAEGGGTKLIIEHLLVKNGRVEVSAAFLKGQKVGSDLRPLELRDIGKSKGGATPAEVAKEILGALTKSAMSAVDDLNIDGLKKGVVDSAVEGVKDLFGGKKKKDK